MGLYIRMGLYFIFAAAASQGLVEFDKDTGEVTFLVDDVVLVITGIVGYLATFWTSRIAKKQGKNT